MAAHLTTFPGMSADDARRFAERWLPAWTGGDADRLIGFYAPDAFYRDPYVTEGLTGKAVIKQYFARLLARNPDWAWTQTAAVPLEGGFLNFWHARIPTGGTVAYRDGVCTVVLDDDGLIRRNEVFFDPTPPDQSARGLLMPLREVTIPAGRCILKSRLSTDCASGCSRGWPLP